MGKSESGRDHLSLSSMNMYLQCPRKWMYRYIHHISDPATLQTEVGTFDHLVLEKLMDEPPENRTLLRAKELAALYFNGDPDRGIPGFRDDFRFAQLNLSEDDIKEFKKRAWLGLMAYFSIEDPTQVDVYANELEIKVDIAGVPFYGKLDRLDRNSNGGIDIVDYKTGKAPLPWFRKKSFSQLLLYVAALTNYIRVIRPNTIKLLYLGGEPEVVSLRAKRDEVKEQAEIFKDTWDSIQESKSTDTWVAKPSPLCEWCPHVAVCPEGTQQALERHARRKVREDAPAVTLLGLEGPYKPKD